MYYLAVKNDTRITEGPFLSWERAWEINQSQFHGRYEVILMDEISCDWEEGN